MMEIVQQYYAAERQFALWCLGIGIALVLLSLILWRTSAAPSLASGMAYALLIAGIFQAVAGAGYIVLVNSRATEAAKTYRGQSEAEIKQQEVARMRKVLKSGYAGGLVTYTALLLLGVALVFVSDGAPRWKGVASGLLIVGGLGHCIEAFSMQANRQYLQAIETWFLG